jgi:hypothetical protein
LRLTDDELSFLVQCLQELTESQQELLSIYGSLKKQHANDLIRTEFDKANKAYSETARKAVATSDMTRRLQSTLCGGRPRGKNLAKIAYGMIASQSS